VTRNAVTPYPSENSGSIGRLQSVVELGTPDAESTGNIGSPREGCSDLRCQAGLPLCPAMSFARSSRRGELGTVSFVGHGQPRSSGVDLGELGAQPHRPRAHFPDPTSSRQGHGSMQPEYAGSRHHRLSVVSHPTASLPAGGFLVYWPNNFSRRSSSICSVPYFSACFTLLPPGSSPITK
jgi:hypothetical protein